MTGVVCALAGGKSKDLVLTTVSFTSNSTWVAPSGVDLVVSAAGKGSAGISDYEGQVAGRQFTAWGFDTPFNVNAPYAQWANIYNSYATVFSQLNLSYPSYGPSALATDYLVFLSANDYWGAITFSPTDLSTTLLTSYNVVVSGSPKTSGNITYSSLSGIEGWSVYIYGYVRGSAGTASTALGKTFPGGTYTGTYPNAVGSAASTTTFTNVAVTPGTSYPIVVPSGGQVTLQYYV